MVYIVAVKDNGTSNGAYDVTNITITDNLPNQSVNNHSVPCTLNKCLVPDD